MGGGNYYKSIMGEKEYMVREFMSLYRFNLSCLVYLIESDLWVCC